MNKMIKCKICKEKVEDTYECERCNKEVCLDCCTNNYPYSTTMCNDCDEKFQSVMADNNFTY